MSFSIKKVTTASISSQAFLPRKEITCPAALKMKLTSEPIRPGKMEPTFLPISLSPFPTAFVPFLIAFIAANDTAPMTKPAARTTACRVQPYFLGYGHLLLLRLGSWDFFGFMLQVKFDFRLNLIFHCSFLC